MKADIKNLVTRDKVTKLRRATQGISTRLRKRTRFPVDVFYLRDMSDSSGGCVRLLAANSEKSNDMIEDNKDEYLGRYYKDYDSKMIIHDIAAHLGLSYLVYNCGRIKKPVEEE